ncbi:MAG TPA: hypothetical protein VGJ07_15740 [Rugosimonospora sp.]
MTAGTRHQAATVAPVASGPRTGNVSRTISGSTINGSRTVNGSGTVPRIRVTVNEPRLAPAGRSPDVAAEHWRRSAEIRREWLHWGLSTEPADRPAAEQALSTIYARLRRPRPRFVWVDSPSGALPLVAGLPTLDTLYQWVMRPPRSGPPPLASDLAASLSRLRSALDERLTRPDFDPPPPKRKNAQQPWPVLPPLDALRAGIPFREVLRQGVRDALRTSLADGFYLPVRAALAAQRPPAVCWYGQQEAYWVAYYDTWRRLGLAQYSHADESYLDVWATLARSCGWWWPGEEVCVIVERPAAIHVEAVPGVHHEQVRPRRFDGPAVEYRDGWCPDLA